MFVTYGRLRIIATNPQLVTRQLSTTRRCSGQQQAGGQVRVRFAPSPTGHIHLGGLRTALYNYIFARQHEGKFVLRIEDTDQTRIVPGSAEEIERVLDWAGIRPDESPMLGGDHGPYEQSKRLESYKAKAHQLVDEGKAYRCFCSATRLDLLRKFQARNRQKTRYDGKCKDLSDSEIKEKLDENDGKYVIRFALAEGTHSFEDLVFGPLSANLVEALESDPIILKSDQYPTYHLASVVDDHHMKISHVLRGSEWISSTTKHIQLYQAFGWQPPQFAHFPLITMRDGAKMSKRNDHSHVQTWIDAGYRPDTLFNFLTQSGGGVPKSKQDSMEFWTLEELVRGFDFQQVTCHPGSLDMNRLAVYSAKELKRIWTQEPDTIMERFRHLLQRRSILPDLDDDSIRTMIDQLIDRLTSLNDLLSDDYAFLWCQPKLAFSTQDFDGNNTKSLIDNLISVIDGPDYEDKAKFGISLKSLAQEHKIEYAKFMKLARKVLTNNDKGLPVYEIVQLLGKLRSKQYLVNGLSYLDKQ